MERKVIKLNLVGAIFVLILIIAIIVFLVSFILKGNKKESNIKNNTKKILCVSNSAFFAIRQKTLAKKRTRDFTP